MGIYPMCGVSRYHRLTKDRVRVTGRLLLDRSTSTLIRSETCSDETGRESESRIVGFSRLPSDRQERTCIPLNGLEY